MDDEDTQTYEEFLEEWLKEMNEPDKDEDEDINNPPFQ